MSRLELEISMQRLTDELQAMQRSQRRLQAEVSLLRMVLHNRPLKSQIDETEAPTPASWLLN